MKATQDRTDNTYDGGVRLRADGAGIPTAKDALKGYDHHLQLRPGAARRSGRLWAARRGSTPSWSTSATIAT
ncbi:hypothetical protein ACRAWD_12565 [Caulobacter segnis]